MEEILGNFGKVISEKAEVVARTAGEVVEVVAKKTEETIEIQKIKSQIRVMTRNNKRDFQDIGKMIYERFQKGQVDDAEFLELCETIQEREKTIEDYKRQVAVIKGLEMCKNCKTHLEPSAVYCPKCGAKAKEDIFVEDSLEEEI